MHLTGKECLEQAQPHWLREHGKAPRHVLGELLALARVGGARHLARGQLELKVDEHFPDPDLEILTVCEFGKISTLAAATLRRLGFRRAVALDGGMKAWRDGGYPLDDGTDAALMI